MEYFIEEGNWVRDMKRILFALVLCSLMIGCEPKRTPSYDELKSKTQELQSQLDKIRTATMQQQKMCDEQARKKFHEDYPAANDLTGFFSHYDTGANVCYMLVHIYGISKVVPSVSDTVYDAFEGRGYASYIWINSEKKKYWQVAPMECSVKPRGQDEITCKSSEEFDSLIDKHFGIGR
jgi:hypothetical protein